eukprot:9485686-Pyramimonas_sp.AAC.3
MLAVCGLKGDELVVRRSDIPGFLRRVCFLDARACRRAVSRIWEHPEVSALCYDDVECNARALLAAIHACCTVQDGR